MKTIAEAMAELKVNRPDGKAYVPDWQKQIPAWSKWYPGSQGKPDCEACKGLGVVRVDVPYTHPFFGKLFACECAAPVRQPSQGGNGKEEIRRRSLERARKDLE